VITGWLDRQARRLHRSQGEVRRFEQPLPECKRSQSGRTGGAAMIAGTHPGGVSITTGKGWLVEGSCRVCLPVRLQATLPVKS
jgi:hypothetical protein